MEKKKMKENLSILLDKYLIKKIMQAWQIESFENHYLKDLNLIFVRFLFIMSGCFTVRCNA